MEKERILVFSDVHGDETAMMRIKEAEKELETNMLLSLGDLCPDPYNPLWRGIVGVRGNMDRFYEYGDLPFPPRELILSQEGRRIIAIHGHEYPSITPEREDKRGYIISIQAPLHAPDLLQVLLSEYLIMSLSLSFLFWTLKESPLSSSPRPNSFGALREVQYL